MKQIHLFTLATYSAVFAFGLWLDQQQTLSQLPLMIAFYSAGFSGLLTMSLYLRPRFPLFWQQLLLIILAYSVWRIAYFPVLVLAGYIATVGEAISLRIVGYSVVYPFFLVSMVLMNAVSFWLASQLLKWFVKPTIGHITRQEQTLFISAIPLALLALTISFTQPADWHVIPDTSFIDDKPLPKPVLPEMNPYYTALDDKTLNWRQRTLFYASAITYDWIPENTRWSQIVRGTLEYEFVRTKNVSTAFCVKVHYRAFIVAHPFLNTSMALEGE